MNTLFRWLVIGLASLFIGCSGDPNEKANELYVQAVQLVESAKQAGSYSEALPLYEQAGDRVEHIASQYSGSNIAVSLVAGQTKISDITLGEFQKIGDMLKQLAVAEQEPISCALMVAKTIKNEFWQAYALMDIAGKLAAAGQFPQALDVANSITKEDGKAYALVDIAGKLAAAGQFPQALDVANSITKEDGKAYALVDIAGKLAAAGQFPQALDVANSITKEDDKAYALVDIAGKLAAAGQFPQALDVANSITKEDDKAYALAIIAGGLAAAGHQPSESDVAILREIFQTAMPMASVWERLGEHSPTATNKE